MIKDTRNEFCAATSAVLAVGNAIIGNVVDTQVPGSLNTLLPIGVGEPLFLVIQVTTTFVGATSTTQLQLVTDSVAALNVSRTVHVDTGAIPVATLVAGYTLVFPLPPQFTYERFMGIWETVATANVTAGAINAFLTHDAARYIPTADAIN
jgi:hypothetical protein